MDNLEAEVQKLSAENAKLREQVARLSSSNQELNDQLSHHRSVIDRNPNLRSLFQGVVLLLKSDKTRDVKSVSTALMVVLLCFGMFFSFGTHTRVPNYTRESIPDVLNGRVLPYDNEYKSASSRGSYSLDGGPHFNVERLHRRGLLQFSQRENQISEPIDSTPSSPVLLMPSSLNETLDSSIDIPIPSNTSISNDNFDFGSCSYDEFPEIPVAIVVEVDSPMGGLDEEGGNGAQVGNQGQSTEGVDVTYEGMVGIDIVRNNGIPGLVKVPS